MHLVLKIQLMMMHQGIKFYNIWIIALRVFLLLKCALKYVFFICILVFFFFFWFIVYLNPLSYKTLSRKYMLKTWTAGDCNVRPKRNYKNGFKSAVSAIRAKHWNPIGKKMNVLSALSNRFCRTSAQIEIGKWRISNPQSACCTPLLMGDLMLSEQREWRSTNKTLRLEILWDLITVTSLYMLHYQ